ncbi:unnamed protein product, partial [marine sediment metagenome]
NELKEFIYQGVLTEFNEVKKLIENPDEPS